MTENIIRACGLCGEGALIIKEDGYDFCVYCSNADCNNDSATGVKHNEALEQWNERQPNIELYIKNRDHRDSIKANRSAVICLNCEHCKAYNIDKLTCQWNESFIELMKGSSIKVQAYETCDKFREKTVGSSG